MIGYVESNFILELALVQEGVDDAQQLLEAAEAGDFDLVIPAFALCEPYDRVFRRGKAQAQSSRQVEDQVFRDLQRNAANEALVNEARATLARLLEVGRNEMDALEEINRRILGCARVLTVTADIHAASMRFQAEHGLTPVDAIIYASVLDDCESQGALEDSFFVSRDGNAFGDPAIVEQLRNVRCEMLLDFAAARNRVGR